MLKLKSKIVAAIMLLTVSFAALCFAQQANDARRWRQHRTIRAHQTNTKPSEDNWRALFNGRNLDGWQHIGPGRMALENGVLRTEGGMGLLWYTKEKFGNCILRVVYKVSDPASNSGVFVRIADRPVDEWFAVHHGYEVQILNDKDEYHRTGAIYSLAKSTALPVRPPGEWNTMLITLQGPRIKVSVNGIDVNDFDPQQPVPERKEKFEPERGPRPEIGYIGLQNHDDYAKGRQTHVYFKEVSVKALPQ